MFHTVILRNSKKPVPHMLALRFYLKEDGLEFVSEGAVDQDVDGRVDGDQEVRDLW